MEKKLFRNLHDKKIAGVASGVADYLQIEVNIVRLLFILSTFFLGGVGLIAYIVLWILSPINPDPSAQFKKFDNFFNENKNPFANCAPLNDDTTNFSTKWNTENFNWKKKENKTATTIIGAFLLITGTYLLLNQFDLIPHFVNFHKLWPLLLIFFGVNFILKSKKNAAFEEFKKQQEKASEPIVTPPPAEKKEMNNEENNQN